MQHKVQGKSYMNMELSRRQFLKNSFALSAGTVCGGNLLAQRRGKLSNQEARYYEKLEDGRVRCGLCPWRCVVESGKRGQCNVRLNREGSYISLVYGRLSAVHNDPIEKKPFYHFLPGSNALSVATAGCNVHCKFCQNWELAQRLPEEIPGVKYSPEELVGYAEELGSHSIAFTYNEPTIFTEYIYDVAQAGRERSIHSVIISNGFIHQTPLRDLCSVIDAYKVDLKAFAEEYYRDVVGGRLRPVLDTLVTLRSEGVWTEIVYLVVPTLNDDAETIKAMVAWIRKELDSDVPLHFSRFYPKYKLRNLPPTPVSTLERCRQIGLEGGLHHVYMGNVPGHSGENTMCPSCGETLIGRVGFRVFENHIENGRCSYCSERISGFWSG